MSNEITIMDNTFDNYACRFIRGTNHRLIIAISSIGDTKSDSSDFEWIDSLNRFQPHDHKLFLIDRSRSWFNNPRGLTALLHYIEKYRYENGIHYTIALGLSMGASAAILLSTWVTIDRVVAISPQFFLGSDAAPWDPRYVELWKKTTWKSNSLFEAPSPSTHYVIIVSVDDKYDIQHAFFASRSTVASTNISFIGVHGDHNIIHEQKKNGTFEAFIRSTLNLRGTCLSYNGFPLTERALAAIHRCWTTHGLVQSAEAFAFVRNGLYSLPWPMYGSYLAYARTESADAAPLAHPLAPLNLSERGNDFLGVGWSYQEPTGVWSIGYTHSINCRILDLNLFLSVEINLDFIGFVTDAHPEQRIEIHCPDAPKQIQTIHFSPTRQEPLIATIPCKSPNLSITIRTPDARSPASLGQSSDDRALGVMLRKIWFTSKAGA